VLAREAVLNHPEIIKLLRAHFVAIAIDNVDNLNMTAAEKEFLRDRGLKFCTQGMSVFTAGGKLLGMGGGFEPDDVKRMLQKALAEYQPEKTPLALPPRDEKDPGLIPPPAGGRALFVTWKVLGSYDRSQSPLMTKIPRYDRRIQDSIGVDRLWLRKDEAEALTRGTLPESLRRRILPHLTYVLAGAKAKNVKQFDLNLRDGRLTGSFQTDMGEVSQLLGFVRAQGGKLTQFDLIARGRGTWVEDCGFSAGLRMVPKGQQVLIGLLFRLADPQDELARVPPHRARHNGYLGK
jgi:hypothetical protein